MSHFSLSAATPSLARYMFQTLKTTAQRTLAYRTTRALLADCRRLLSERGQANSVAIATALVGRLSTLDRSAQRMFFEQLATDFSPDPAAVLARAQEYARDPTASNLIALTHAAEPPRQELFRRINRAPGGTAALVQLRRALLEHILMVNYLYDLDRIEVNHEHFKNGTVVHSRAIAALLQ